MTARVLITDPIAPEGVDLLARECHVDVRLGLNGEELKAAISEYQALVVRSETRVTREVIECGKALRVIGRAGVGVDNIAVDAATEHGIVVVNAPAGNTVSAAELAVALVLALARHVPDAAASLRGGRWDRRQFIGTELRGKTVGIIGFGQVGSSVARRLLAFDTQVLAFDPFVPEERARVLGVQLVDLPTLLAQSDIVTLHSTVTPDAAPLLGKDEIGQMKPGARLINTARGGLVDEAALLEALESGHLGGAALDVFSTEPAVGLAITQHPLVIATPHLGASTQEAQERVAVDVAAELLRVLAGQPAMAAVNAPFVDPASLEVIGPYLAAAEMAGRLATQLATGQFQGLRIAYQGEIANHDVTPLKAAAVAGLLAPISDEHVNLVSVNNVIAHRGWQVSEEMSQDAAPYANLVRVTLLTSAGPVGISATLEHGHPHIVEIDGFTVHVSGPDLGEARHILLLHNEDRPGRIGAVGALLGGLGVNISAMDVGKRDASGSAVMVLTVDRGLEPEELESVGRIDGIERVVQARL